MPARRATMTISLPPELADELRDYADARHHGNVSAAVRELVRDGVTKSAGQLVRTGNARTLQ